ncbi:MAG TPA: Imm7 family immunity protein [Ktedonobacterales bacterium]|nr:Imm7 family immunity protein [Ktedonobacterales bacterium]
MFEVHGWATIRLTPENRDRDDEEELHRRAMSQIESQVGYYVNDLGWAYNPLLEMRKVNGEALIRVEGFSNHAGTLMEDLQALFHTIAEVAPGSYGLIYTMNDEEPAYDNEFRVYVLARGTLVERNDPFLSPFVPVVEDPYHDD